MHPISMHMYGHKFFMDALDGLDMSHVEDPGVCGVWSAKDVVGHIGVGELALVEILEGLLGFEGPRPVLQTMFEHGPATANDIEAEKRKDHSYTMVLNEYLAAYKRVTELLAKIPTEQFIESGLLKWYGPDYDLEDFLVYSYYAHKREHGAQINVLKDRVKG
jgi:hypothetical protein